MVHSPSTGERTGSDARSAIVDTPVCFCAGRRESPPSLFFSFDRFRHHLRLMGRQIALGEGWVGLQHSGRARKGISSGDRGVWGGHISPVLFPMIPRSCFLFLPWFGLVWFDHSSTFRSFVTRRLHDTPDATDAIHDLPVDDFLAYSTFGPFSEFDAAATPWLI